MIQVNVKEKEIKFPNKWNEITVAQADFVINKLSAQTIESKDWVSIISGLSGESEESIMGWPYQQFINMIVFMFNDKPEWTPISKWTDSNGSIEFNQELRVEQYLKLIKAGSSDSPITNMILSIGEITTSREDVEAWIKSLPFSPFIPLLSISSMLMINSTLNLISN